MREISVMFTFVLSVLMSGKTLACAGCLDLYPEIVVLNSATNRLIMKSVPSLVQNNESILLEKISCSIPNEYMGSIDPSCMIRGIYESNRAEFEINFAGESAIAFSSQLRGVTAEIQVVDEEGDEAPRTGERFKVGLLNQTLEATTVSIPEINTGKLSCPKVNGSNRCEIELNVLNVSYIFAQ